MEILKIQITTGITLLEHGIVNILVRLIRTRYVSIKRAVDIILAFVATINTIPLIIVLGSIIKLTSRGPIFYTQTRIGKGGKPFKIIKFRTMRVDAEAGTGPVWAKSEDPRVTKVGYYMRKLHIDEIPQFINILMGDMSFVGPRPERPVFVNEFQTKIQDYPQRLMVKPGLTGLAQVRHKYDETLEDVKKKLSYDLFYVKKMCLFIDCKIFLWTAGKVLSTFKEFFRTKTTEPVTGLFGQRVFSS